MTLELLCPECGDALRASVDQLGKPLICKACDSKLFLHPNGELIAGDPPPLSRASSSPWSAVRYAREKPDALERFLVHYRRIPRVVRWVAAAAVVVAGVGLIGRALTGPRLPETLVERVVFVGEAFAYGDERRLRAIADPAGENDVVRWCRRIRPSSWKGRIRDVRVRAQVYLQDRKRGKAESLAFVAVIGVPGGSGSTRAAAGPSEPAPARPPPRTAADLPKDAPATPADESQPAALAGVPGGRLITLRLFWVLDDQGTWRLDGRRILHSVAKAR